MSVKASATRPLLRLQASCSFCRSVARKAEKFPNIIPGKVAPKRNGRQVPRTSNAHGNMRVGEMLALHFALVIGPGGRSPVCVCGLWPSLRALSFVHLQSGVADWQM